MLTSFIVVVDAVLVLGDRGSTAAQLICLFLLIFALVFAYAWPVFMGATGTLGTRAALGDAPTTVSIVTGVVMTIGFALVIFMASPLFEWFW
ncbi:MAG: hypothetical protein SFZ23_07950 [Planctomycetota bacterium]|nr:hypothetical protein [Planctomycetota bacterium]